MAVGSPPGLTPQLSVLSAGGAGAGAAQLRLIGPCRPRARPPSPTFPAQGGAWLRVGGDVRVRIVGRVRVRVRIRVRVGVKVGFRGEGRDSGSSSGQG